MPKKIDEENLFLEVVRTIVDLGIGKATTKQIAKAAGVNEVTLFRKYGNKSGLICEAFQQILATSPLNELDYSGNLESDLIRIVKAYKETSFLYGEVIPIIIAEIPRDPDLRELLDPFLSVVQSIMKIIQIYQREGVLRNEPGFSAVSALLGPIIISRMLQKTNPDFQVDEIEDQRYVKAFLDGRRQISDL
jgi:AcrR family transcriptional regulator